MKKHSEQFVAEGVSKGKYEKVEHPDIPGEVLYTIRAFKQEQCMSRTRKQSLREEKIADESLVKQFRSVTAKPLLQLAGPGSSSSSGDQAPGEDKGTKRRKVEEVELPEGQQEAEEQEEEQEAEEEHTDGDSVITDKDSKKLSAKASSTMSAVQKALTQVERANSVFKNTPVTQPLNGQLKDTHTP